ncbi:universal stress protein [Hanstruepera marina]|uniref:universal stress protein n=1 Tax=Hanstruepera marina TaxID=2873265 RepID=UPI001CA712D3|nr:universal stress protein [Hanstruepera marina]
MKTILLPTDFSENSWRAIQYALQLFKSNDCKFYIMHVFEPQASAPSTGITSKRAYQAIHDSRAKSSQEGLDKILQQVQDYSNNPKHTFETKLAYGSLTNSVQGFADNNDIDLVVVGNKGASAIQKATFGSNAAQLILKLTCPIIAVPESATTNINEIGFATDYSIDDYGEGLNLLREITLSNKARLAVVNVVNNSEYITDLNAKREMLEQVLKPLTLEYYTLTDVPVEQGIHVFTESRKLDMLVLITKKRSFFEKLTTRSHSKAISHNLDVPLIVFDQRSF